MIAEFHALGGEPNMRRSTGVFAGLVLALAGGPAAAQDLAAAGGAQPARQMLDLAAGESVAVGGVVLQARQDSRAVAVTSSELVSVAVISGDLVAGGAAAGPGQALVTPIDGTRTRRYGFDARRLAASLPPIWQERLEAPLAELAHRQRSRAFWGLVEPVGVNAVAPVAPAAESFRAAYLTNPTVLELRRAAAGDRDRLASLTLERFVTALRGREEEALAALIDPVPFMQASEQPQVWQAARTAFARQLASDALLVQALSAGGPEPAAASGDPVFEIGGAFRIALVQRDRAFFIAAVEPVA